MLLLRVPQLMCGGDKPEIFGYLEKETYKPEVPLSSEERRT
jgi:hypothetical protein